VTPVATSPLTRSTPLRVGAAAALGCVALAAWNPGDHGVEVCPTKLLTGLDCPLCGGLRAVASLTRGHVARAADHNVLVVALAPRAVLWWCAWWLADRRGRPAPRLHVGRAVWVAVVAIAVAFTVVRNLHVGGLPHWLASARS
jgi:hypothetical protein